MSRTALTVQPGRSRPCRARRLSHAVHRQPDRAGAGARVRQAEARHHRAGSSIQDPVHSERRVLRQAHPRPRHCLARGDRLRPEAARGRCLRALQDRRSVAVLPDRSATSRVANSRLGALLEVLAEARARRRELPDRRARQARRADAHHPQQVNEEAATLWNQVVDVRIKRVDLPERTCRRSTAACRPSGSGRRPSSAPKARAPRAVSAAPPTARSP